MHSLLLQFKSDHDSRSNCDASRIKCLKWTLIVWLNFTKDMTFSRSSQDVRINIFDVNDFSKANSSGLTVILSLFACCVDCSLPRFCSDFFQPAGLEFNGVDLVSASVNNTGQNLFHLIQIAK